MMQIKNLMLLPVAAIALTLAGCGQGAGTHAGADSSVGTDTDSKGSVDRNSGLTAGRTSKATVSMPASAIIADAARAAAPLLATPGKADDNDWLFWRQAQFFLIAKDEHWKDWGPGQLGLEMANNKHLSNPDKQKADFQKDADAFIQYGIANPVTAPVANAKAECAKLGVTKTPIDAYECYQRFYMKGSVLLHILFAHKSSSGWEMKTNKGEYAMGNLISANFASLWESELAANLTAKTLKDPDAAKQKVLKMVMDLPIEKVAAASKQVAIESWQEQAQGITSLISGGQKCNPQWTIGGTDLCCGQTGCVVTKNGVTWFGEGAANGKKYEVALESSISATIETKTATSMSQDAKTSTQNKAGSDVK